MRPINLADAIAIEFGSRRCPCCRSRMTASKVKKNRPMPRTVRTRGHVDPVALNGNRSHYLYICHGCNNDQGMMNFDNWAANLRRAGDARAEAVAAVAAAVRRWRERHARIET